MYSSAEPQFTLTVLLYTFNHSAYIEQCLAGIYAQVTNFNFEVLIADNYSTDGSRKKIKDYIEAHSNPSLLRARFFPQNENLGNRKNLMELLDYCEGKYIAVAEGDDYWTDPEKLQIQVDFLEKHTDYSMCCHEADIYDEQKKQILRKRKRDPFSRDMTMKEIILGGGSQIPTISVVYRHDLVRKYPDYYMAMSIGDYPLFLMLAAFGKTFRFARNMAVYRFNLNGSNWTSQYFKPESFRKRYNVHMSVNRGLEMFKAGTGGKYNKYVNTTISARRLSLLLDNYDDEFRKTDYHVFKRELKYSHKLILGAIKFTPAFRRVWKLYKDVVFFGSFGKRFLLQLKSPNVN